MWGAWLSCPIPILPALKPPAPGMERAPAGVPKAVLVKTQLPTTGSSPAVDRDGAVLAKLLSLEKGRLSHDFIACKYTEDGFQLLWIC